MARTDWLVEAGWGVFNHYLAHGASSPGTDTVTPASWNARVNSFDVPRLVAQLEEVGAGYYVLTLGQNHGFYCSPNETYDRLTAQTPSRLATRDLVGDLAEALGEAGIRMMVYLPSHAPAYNRDAVEALRCTPVWEASRWQLGPGTYVRSQDVDERLSTFQRHWESVIREWSLRWGTAIHGWWFDGCYYADRMYRHPDEPNFASFAAAARAGNPAAVVAFNPGVNVPIVSHSDVEDYTAGEIANALPVGQWGPAGSAGAAATVNGAQYHVLTFLGSMWGRGEPRFTPTFVKEYSDSIITGGGVISWDVPVTGDGRIPESFLPHLSGLKA